MIALRVMAVSLALLGSVAGQVTQTKTPDKTMEMLSGAWEVTKVQDAQKQKLPVGSTVVFSKDKSIKIFYGVPEKTQDISEVSPPPSYREGTWSLDKDVITISFPPTAVKQSIKITRLTDYEMTTTNSDGNWMEYKKRTKHRIE